MLDHFGVRLSASDYFRAAVVFYKANSIFMGKMHVQETSAICGSTSLPIEIILILFIYLGSC